jgi:hypothetical protein
VKKTVVNILARFCFILAKAGARAVFSLLEAGLARCAAGACGDRLILNAMPRSTSSFLLSFLTLNDCFYTPIVGPNSFK